jgi:hypothetical protein
VDDVPVLSYCMELFADFSVDVLLDTLFESHGVLVRIVAY